MDGNDIIFVAVEKYEGKEIIFTRQKLEQKKDDHPELLKKSFLECTERALKNPDELWENYNDNKKRCYYKKYSTRSYAKVIVWIHDKPYRVVSAYEVTYIKETKYPNLKRLI